MRLRTRWGARAALRDLAALYALMRCAEALFGWVGPAYPVALGTLRADALVRDMSPRGLLRLNLVWPFDAVALLHSMHCCTDGQGLGV